METLNIKSTILEDGFQNSFEQLLKLIEKHFISKIFITKNLLESKYIFKLFKFYFFVLYVYTKKTDIKN
ncbi:hypothetical protein BpHYR1_051566 [Brachionus plicatilis]|uniref:Uncharacterized protein n=1 Tax=Brachionus plicatilis TaxID=10195 RepID=A0A3M7RM96_BRAPC|nr:hypothetical protein BpHYR1_051566 [Brachionus plicatilis]